MLKNNKKLGNFGEDIACKYLEKNNYKILERNFFSKFGEIDIIATKNKEYIFLEVKTRSNINYGFPAEAINLSKKRHLINTAKFYIYFNCLEYKPIRFDVIEVYIKERIYINHIKNIF